MERTREEVRRAGDFRYPRAAEERALTYFFSKRPFLFPQVSMKKGFHQGSAYFITCNLSIGAGAAGRRFVRQPVSCGRRH